MGEFELIRRFFMPLANKAMTDQLVLGPGDDCAIQRVPEGRDLVFSVDTLVEGVHFPENYSPYYLGWRALAVATSDLAAMGATPVCFTLALTMPEAQPEWLADFAHGLAKASDAFGIALAGGDTTRGPLAVSVQVHGTVAQGSAIRRSGARPGDLICVSGPLGAAGAALDFLGATHPGADQQAVLARYHFPEPRFVLGQQLIGKASAAIDISDGLLADLDHILEQSGVGAELDAKNIPMLPALHRLKGDAALSLALTAGDDYELCVTIAPDQYAALAPEVQGALIIIGCIQQELGLRMRGAEMTEAPVGFDHFGRSV
ncbi:thiamine-phosphate kinase [Marinobacter sp. LQ44]|uniref:thiamine-phosphate kinase n=1 Tax=Marinobacter TaxID=2742 RepID=UPI000718C56B|nr:thiamine-phosphate kinase [Marinobacter sp. LQ44]AMQ89943.1 thiamine-phosphate kinase [Marinobacter sp. LQ44]